MARAVTTCAIMQEGHQKQKNHRMTVLAEQQKPVRFYSGVHRNPLFPHRSNHDKQTSTQSAQKNINNTTHWQQMADLDRPVDGITAPCPGTDQGHSPACSAENIAVPASEGICTDPTIEGQQGANKRRTEHDVNGNRQKCAPERKRGCGRDGYNRRGGSGPDPPPPPLVTKKVTIFGHKIL